MFRKLTVSVLSVLMLLVSLGCSTTGFLPIEDSPRGYSSDQTLGLRAGVDTGSLSPTERYSWLEVCDKVVSPVLKFWTSVEYRNCEPNVPLTQVAQKTTTTGYVAGIVGPVISTGMTAAAIAYAGHEIGQGIGRSGSTETNNVNNGNSNSNSARQGQGQLQGQGQVQGQKQGQIAQGGSADARATGGQGGVGNGGQGGVGNGGQGGVGNGGHNGNNGHDGHNGNNGHDGHDN